MLRKILIPFILGVLMAIGIAATTAEASHQFIIINKGNNTLAFYENRTLTRTFPVATGKNPTDTPEGKFKVVTKIVNPPYHKLKIPGGDARNPLGPRWIGFNARGTSGTTYGVHGTNNLASIGGYVSEGCIRMYNDDVKWLYDRVKTGIPLVIVRSDKSFDDIAKANGLSVNPPAQANKTYKVTASTLNVRQGPGMNQRIVGSLKRNQNITVNSTSGGWGQITYNGKTAYVSMQYLAQVSSTPAQPAQNVAQVTSNTYKVTASVLNVRQGAGLNHRVIGSLKRNQVITVASISDGWAKINYNGKVAYVSTQFLTRTNPPAQGGENQGGGGNYVVTASVLNVRQGAGLNHRVIGSVRRNQTISVTSASGEWTQINYNGKTAYVNTRYIRKK